MVTAPAIDFEAVARTVDLATVIAADLGPPARGRKWRCPFHEDTRPSLSLTPDRRHWRCWSCGERGDALDWLSRREGIDLVQAVARLDPTAVAGRGTRSPTPPPGASAATRPTDSPSPPPEPVWRSPEWQAAVDRIVTQAEAALWSPAGRRALEWLRSRGLADCTIARFRLGFIPRDLNTAPIEILGHNHRDEPKGIWVRRGILLPWVAPGAVYSARVECDHRWIGANVHRLAADVFAPLDRPPKYMALAGSTRGHLYPWHEVLETQGIRPTLLVEGELDALLAEQAAGHLVQVGTVGGAQQAPDRSALLALARCTPWLIATDHDEAGIEAAWRWRELAPHKARRVMLPRGKDLGEFVEAGGDVREWLATELARVGRTHA
jgi:DNA primase